MSDKSSLVCYWITYYVCISYIITYVTVLKISLYDWPHFCTIFTYSAGIQKRHGYPFIITQYANKILASETRG